MGDEGFGDRYNRAGMEAYYREHGDDYSNPHEGAVVAAVEHALTRWPIDASRVLDLAAGSGEATLAVARLRPAARVEGLDPFTHALYERRTGRRCAAASFEDVARGAQRLAGCSLIVCSCALHLVRPSWLPTLCLALAAAAPDLLVITPVTRPEIQRAWGWTLADSAVCVAADRTARVRLRWYRRVEVSEG